MTKKMKDLNNLYSISYTPAGPIIGQEMTVQEAFENPTIYEEKKKEFFYFDEAKEIVVDWFKSRAETIDLLDDKSYFEKDPVTVKEYDKFMEKVYEG